MGGDGGGDGIDDGLTIFTSFRSDNHCNLCFSWHFGKKVVGMVGMKWQSTSSFYYYLLIVF